MNRLDGVGWTIDRRNHVFVVPVDRTAPPRQITDGAFDHGPPAWAPDSGRLVCAAARHDQWDLDPAVDLWVLDAAGAEPPPCITDVAGEFRWLLGVRSFDHADEHLRMSPVSYVQDIHTPLQILHSEQGLRCDVEQADQLFTMLRLLGREVEYWRFPAESHELSRSGSPVHRQQRAEIILDWFDRWLKPA